MHSLNTPKDYYGLDNASSIIIYFLANATAWKGEVARRVKNELKELIE